MIEPFYEEEFKWFEIELYNCEDVAEKGDHADIKKFGSDDMPDLNKVAVKAKEFGYDSFSIKEMIEIQRDYSVDEFEEVS